MVDYQVVAVLLGVAKKAVFCCLAAGLFACASSDTESADARPDTRDAQADAPGDLDGDVPKPQGCDRDPSQAGDTQPCTIMNFPQDTFWSADGGGGRIIDVTRPPFNAIGDGTTDDTAALVAAYDFVMNEIADAGWDNFFPKTNAPSFILYLPDGVYRVTDTVIYSGPVQDHYIGNTESLAWIRFVGQSREGTVIRLDDQASGFGNVGSPKPVLSFGKTDFNNLPASNSLRNLSIEVGAGNPGAIGVKFGGANQSDIHNVRIASLDPEKRGAVGLDNRIGTVLSLQTDLLIEGFEVGVRMLPYHFTMPALEHITLRGQRRAGVEVVDGLATLRKVRSENTVPALLVTGPGGHAVISDSELEGGTAEDAAIEVRAGHLFARDIAVQGYRTGVRQGDADTVTGDVDEYVSHTPVQFFGDKPTRSLRLPVMEYPRVAWGALSEWVRPQTPGDGVADATNAVQAAMNTGKSTIYFPGHAYRVTEPIDVPCSVRRIAGLFTVVSGSAGVKFRVGACDEPLLIEDVTTAGGVGVEHVGVRPLVMSRVTSRAFAYRNSVTEGRPTLFANAVNGIKAANPLKNLTAYLRIVNSESLEGQFVIDDANVWVFGFKSEKSAPAFTVRNEGKLEVLGGIINQYSQEPASIWPGKVAIINENATMSIVAATNGPNKIDEGFEILVRDTQGAQTRELRWDSDLVPDRVGRLHNEVIPLYRSE